MKIWSGEIKELEILFASLKGHSNDLEKELEQLIKTEDANVVMLYSRRCLEVIITDLCECELQRPRKTEPLKGIIDKLNQEEKVPPYIIASMHSLNSLSTFGAHPKEYEPEQVKPVLNNLSTILKWYLKYKTEKAEAEGSYKVHDTGEKKQVTGYKVQGGESQGGRPSVIDTNLKEIKESHQISKSGKKPYMIISGILVIAVLLYIVFDQFQFFRKDKFEDVRDPDGKISIAVMPFENLTGDTTLNWFQRGISSLIINGLGNSSELAVRDDHTMFEVMESMNQVYTAGISPSIAKEVARKVKAETYISGSFQGREDKYWILVNLVNTENGDIIWTNKVQGNLKSSGYLEMADSLCNEVKNYLEIKALENNADYDFREAYPKSADAYRYFIEGMNFILAEDYEPAVQSLKKAVEIDTTFTFASFYIAFAYNYNSQALESLEWIQKAYAGKNRLPYKYHPILEQWYACFFSKNQNDIIRYCRQFEEMGIESRLLWFDLGVTYTNFTELYEKAVVAFDKVMQMSLERGGYWEYSRFYQEYGNALHHTGQHEKEKEIYDIGLSMNPENAWCIAFQAVCCTSRGDSLCAVMNIKKLKSWLKDNNWTESQIENGMGNLYLTATDSIEAEKHFRNAYNMDNTKISYILNLANVLINTKININEGLELIQQAFIIDPESAKADWLKGRGLYKQGKFEEGLVFLRRAEEKWTGFDKELHKDVLEVEQTLAIKNKTK
jgi:TolB-like protein/Tfp pilus assembly protein PilF